MIPDRELLRLMDSEKANYAIARSTEHSASDRRQAMNRGCELTSIIDYQHRLRDERARAT